MFANIHALPSRKLRTSFLSRYRDGERGSPRAGTWFHPGRHLVALPLVLASTLAWSANHEVIVGGAGFKFSPASLKITVGDSVTFRNAGGNHNVHADDDSFRCADGCRDNGGLGDPSTSDWESTVVFNEVGTVGYRCDPHAPVMRGSITVQEADDEPPPSDNMPIDSGFTGSWYNADQSGHGFNVEVLPNDGILAYWYVFDDAGTPQWIIATGTIDGDTATLDAARALGGFFPPNFDPDAVLREPWGQLTFTFSDCLNGHVAWTTHVPGFSDGELDITRLTYPAGIVCPAP